MSNSPLHFSSSFRIDDDLSDQPSPTLPPREAAQTQSAASPYLIQRFQNALQKTNNYTNTLAYIKIISAMFVLLLTETTCNQSLPIWIFMMMFYDLMGIIGRMIKTQLGEEASPAVIPNSQPNDAQEGYVLNPVINPVALGQQTDEEDTLLRTMSDRGSLLDSPVRMQAYKYILRLIEKYSPWYYAVLFFYGNSVIFDPESDCPVKAPLLHNLAVGFIILQYITISLPLVFCFSVLCICFSTLCLGFVSIYKSHRQAQMNQNIIDQLPSRKYPIRLAGDPECSICMCAYEDGNEIIQLDCSKMHHFHGDCIKKWLKVNGICPICRTKLEDMKKEKTNKEEDSENPKAR